MSPIIATYANGEPFYLKPHTLEDKKGISTAMLLNGEWVEGPKPDSASFYESLPDTERNAGNPGFVIKTKTLWLKSQGYQGTVTGLRLYDHNGKLMSERKQLIPLGEADCLDLTWTFAGDYKTNIGKYSLYLLVKELKASGIPMEYKIN